MVRYVCLCGSEEVIKKRLAAWKCHFMNPVLLPSQFEILEQPEDAIKVDVTGSPEEMAVKFDAGWGYDQVERERVTS